MAQDPNQSVTINIMYTDDPAGVTDYQAPSDNNFFMPLKADRNGILWTRFGIGSDPLTGDNPDSDNIAVSTPFGLDVNGYSKVFDGATWDRQRSLVDNADGIAVNTSGLIGVVQRGTLFNETTYDRQRGNTELTLLASAARTASVNGADFTNYNSRGLHVIINVSSITASPSITVTIQGKDPISATYYDILVGSAITTTGINILKVYPGIATSPNGAASDIIPRTFRVSISHADADSITYSIGGSLIL